MPIMFSEHLTTRQAYLYTVVQRITIIPSDERKGESVMSEDRSIPDTSKPEKSEEYLRTEALTHTLLAAPKAEIDEQMKTAETKKKPKADLT